MRNVNSYLVFTPSISSHHTIVPFDSRSPWMLLCIVCCTRIELKRVNGNAAGKIRHQILFNYRADGVTISPQHNHTTDQLIDKETCPERHHSNLHEDRDFIASVGGEELGTPFGHGTAPNWFPLGLSLSLSCAHQWQDVSCDQVQVWSKWTICIDWLSDCGVEKPLQDY